MPDFVEDVDIYPLMLELLGCLCDEIENSGLPGLCRCELMPGNEVVLDFGAGSQECKDGCGQAWLRLENIAMTQSFPELGGVVLVETCAVRPAYILEMGISRCESSGKTVAGKFIAPTAAEQREAVRQYTADAAAMRRAVTCCFREKFDETVDVALGAWTPLPSAGGNGGGIWQIYLQRA